MLALATNATTARLPSRVRSFAPAALLVLACALVIHVCLIRASHLRASWPPEADTYYLPPSASLKVASLGHTELAADLIHARANVYFGTQLHARVPTKWLASYLRVAIDLDPKFERLYMAGAAMLIYNGQKISPDMVLSAIEVLERGRAAFPFDWEFPFQLGFNFLFELPQDAGEDDPRVPGWRQQGVDWLRQAALYQGVPYYIPNLVARMLTRQGADDLAIQHLEQAYAVATSPDARAQISSKLIALHAERASAKLEDELAAYRRMIAARFPYAPEAFALVAGERRTAPGVFAQSSPAASSGPQP
jgi:hypothetical protein